MRAHEGHEKGKITLACAHVCDQLRRSPVACSARPIQFRTTSDKQKADLTDTALCRALKGLRKSRHPF